MSLPEQEAETVNVYNNAGHLVRLYGVWPGPPRHLEVSRPKLRGVRVRRRSA